MGITRINGMDRQASFLVLILLNLSFTCVALSTIMVCMGKHKNPHAQALGSLGGKARAKCLSDSEIAKIASKGGQARATKLSAAERSRIAKLAVAARERKRKGEN